MKKYNFSNKNNKKSKPNSISSKANINKSSSEPKNEIPIIDLLKCPICKNICLMNINKDKLLFSFECNNNHNNRLKKSKTCINNTGDNYFNSNFSDIHILPENENSILFNKDNNTSNQNITYYSKKIKGEQKIYITENDFTCSKHLNAKYVSYCNDCKENFCQECSKDHFNHNKIFLNSIKPKDNEVISCKKEIIKKEEELNIIFEKMLKWKSEFEYGLSTIIKIMQNISNLRQFIINNYDIKQSNQNYNYINNFNNMKGLDFLFPELLDFFKEKNWKKRGYILIELIINIQNKIIENKEKMKIKQLKEEIDKKTQILKQKLEFQEKKEKNILKARKNDINTEENLDMDSETTHSNKKKNFKSTFISDCINNDYFCRDVSRKIVNNRNTKKKMLEKRNRHKDDNTLTHTIEQNKELEKKLIEVNEKKSKDSINQDQKIDLDPKIIKDVESKKKYNLNSVNSSKNNEDNQNINKINSSINENSNKINNNLEEIKNNNIENDYNSNNKDNVKNSLNEQNEENKENFQKEKNDQIDENKQNEEYELNKENVQNEENAQNEENEQNEINEKNQQYEQNQENAKNEEYEQALANEREFVYWLYHFKQKDELILKNIL